MEDSPLPFDSWLLRTVRFNNLIIIYIILWFNCDSHTLKYNHIWIKINLELPPIWSLLLKLIKINICFLQSIVCWIGHVHLDYHYKIIFYVNWYEITLYLVLLTRYSYCIGKSLYKQFTCQKYLGLKSYTSLIYRFVLGLWRKGISSCCF